MRSAARMSLVFIAGAVVGLLLARQYHRPHAGQFTDELPSRIVEAMNRRADIVCDEVPMKQVVDLIGRAYGVSIRIHEDKLPVFTFDIDRPLDVRMPNASLAQVLFALQRDYDLFAITDEQGLLLVPHNIARNRLIVRLYDVGAIYDKLREDMTATEAAGRIQEWIVASFVETARADNVRLLEVVVNERMLFVTTTSFRQQVIAQKLNELAAKLGVARE